MTMPRVWQFLFMENAAVVGSTCRACAARSTVLERVAPTTQVESQPDGLEKRCVAIGCLSGCRNKKRPDSHPVSIAS